MSLQAYHQYVSDNNWRSPDVSLLDDRRGPVPAVPLDSIPPPWRDWVADTERATGAPADYVLQSVLAGIVAVCGAGVRVRVTPVWDEPLVLWLAAVGEPSTGKSAALAPMLRLLEVVEQERQLGDADRRAAHAERVAKEGETMPFVPSQVVADDVGDPAVLAEIVAANPRGLLLWRDGPAVRIGGEEGDDADRATVARGLGGPWRHRNAAAPAGAVGPALSGQHRRGAAPAAAQGDAAEAVAGDGRRQPGRALSLCLARAAALSRARRRRALA